MSAEHEIKMSCFCPERHRERYEDGTSECTYCGRKWDTEEDKERAKRANRLKGQNGIPFMRRPQIEEVMWGGRQEGKAVWLEYIDRNNELSERLIKPKQIQKTVVKAHCYTRDAERLFIYDRIHRCRVVDNVHEEAVMER